MRNKAKIALSAALLLAASAAWANDGLGHGQTRAPGLDRYAMVHRIVSASPSSIAWDSVGQPTGSMCPLLEGYPDCH